MPLSIREALRLVSEECPEHAETLRDWIVRGKRTQRREYDRGVREERERAVQVCRDVVRVSGDGPYIDGWAYGAAECAIRICCDEEQRDE